MGVLCLKGALIEWMEGTAQTARDGAPEAVQGLINP
ncbi:hypothetical protein HDF09_003459 [Edaphobacter lichenicola]|jgi:hypothetical protein|uniref:Uncharacterized protein n=1 Tax=Tunturiibacter empetritectus TaxID=3069691 RepID=A0A7W8MTF0_9BACT|nr:hypothetical protein [Edaphobacter lichenicola]